MEAVTKDNQQKKKINKKIRIVVENEVELPKNIVKIVVQSDPFE